MKILLTGNVGLELLASYFTDAGYEVLPQDAPPEAQAEAFVYDVTAHDRVLADEVDGFLDPRLERLSGCRYSRDGIRALADELGWRLASAPKKILAVDADNTLWRGIVSEDGFDAVSPYRTFQAGLKALRDDGVVLVLLSKNDPFATRADNVPPVDLSLFAVRKVAWSPKAGNLIEACRALNLPTDSVVFVDDNPHERAQMKAHLPEVTVADFNGFPDGDTEKAERQLVRRLREYFFSDMGRTLEDRLRAADYARQRTLPAETRDRESYLDGLGLWVRPAAAGEGDLDRLAQMAGKTNQFNATTIRRTRADFVRLLADAAQGPRVYVFRAGDRFGEQGLVCYVVVDRAARRITDFVMSCRAMGRTLEHFALAYVERALGCRPAIDFVPTAKNRPFAEFRAFVDAQRERTPSRAGGAVTDGLVSHFTERKD